VGLDADPIPPQFQRRKDPRSGAFSVYLAAGPDSSWCRCVAAWGPSLPSPKSYTELNEIISVLIESSL